MQEDEMVHESLQAKLGFGLYLGAAMTALVVTLTLQWGLPLLG